MPHSAISHGIDSGGRATSAVVREEPFEALEEEWATLLSASQANPHFATPGWKRLWWKHLAPQRRPRLFAVRKERLLGLLPFVDDGDGGALMGDPEVNDYLDLVYLPGEIKRMCFALGEVLQGNDWSHVDLHCLAEDSATLRLARCTAAALGYDLQVEQEDVCPTLTLPSTWDEYLSGLSKKDRHELRRKLRRLEQAGVSRYQRLASANIGMQDADDFLSLLRSSRTEKAQFLNPARESYFRALLNADGLGHEVALYFLEFDGRRVAGTLCLEGPGELALYNSGFDPEYRSLSVGLLLKSHCVRDAIERGYSRFNFLRGAEPYKYDLGAHDTFIYHCRLQRPTTTGRAIGPTGLPNPR